MDNRLIVRTRKEVDKARGLKAYRPILVDIMGRVEKPARRSFKRCADAEIYGTAVVLRKFRMDSMEKGLKNVIESIIEAGDSTTI